MSTSEHPAYKLTYFDLDGRAEVARLLFAEAGVPFEDVRIPFEKWASFKPTMPYGQVPLLEFDGKSLYGSDDWEGAKIDEIILKINEELEKIVPVVRETDKKKQAELFPVMLKEVFVPLVALLEMKLASSDSDWMIGNKISAADLSIYHTVVNLPHDPRLPAHDFASLDNFPHVARLIERVSQRPNIKKYLDEKKKRQEKK